MTQAESKVAGKSRLSHPARELVKGVASLGERGALAPCSFEHFTRQWSAGDDSDGRLTPAARRCISMPELPEVETMRRGILAVVGSRIHAVERAECKLRPIEVRPTIGAFRKRAVGRTIAGVDRVGKRVVVRLDSG